MKSLVEGVRIIFSRKDSLVVGIVSALLFLGLLFVVQNGKDAIALLSFGSLSFFTKVNLFFSTLFNVVDTFTFMAFLVAVAGSLLGGLNISLTYTYMKMRGEVILKSGLYNGMGLLFAFLGVHCAACGTALLGLIFSLLGMSAFINVLPYHGQEIGYLGLMVLVIATYTLAKKVTAPNVC